MSKNKSRPAFPLWPDEARRWYGIDPPLDAVALVRVDEGVALSASAGVVMAGGRVLGTVERFTLDEMPEGFAPIRVQASWLILDAGEARVLDILHTPDEPKVVLDRAVSSKFAESVKRKLYARGSNPTTDIARLGDALKAIDTEVEDSRERRASARAEEWKLSRYDRE